MDINKVDKIVISSNKKMELIIKWFQDNEFLLSDKPFKTPIKKGFVELKEEHVGFSFDNHGKIVTLTIYFKHIDDPNSDYIPTVTLDYNITTGVKSNYIWHMSMEKRRYAQMLLGVDNTIHKEILKYCAIMCYMAYNRQYIESSESKTVHHKSETVRPSKRHNSLVSKVYVLDSVCVGHHNSPSYEFEVRGYYRHYKSGKVIWIDGFTKCKGKGKPQNKNYQF
jgi:hypothetical protein